MHEHVDDHDHEHEHVRIARLWPDPSTLEHLLHLFEQMRRKKDGNAAPFQVKN